MTICTFVATEIANLFLSQAGYPKEFVYNKFSTYGASSYLYTLDEKKYRLSDHSTGVARSQAEYQFASSTNGVAAALTHLGVSVSVEQVEDWVRVNYPKVFYKTSYEGFTLDNLIELGVCTATPAAKKVAANFCEDDAEAVFRSARHSAQPVKVSFKKPTAKSEEKIFMTF